MLMERYQGAVDQLFAKVRSTQTENIIKAGQLIADTVEAGGCIFLGAICHGIQRDLIHRGGGPTFYQHFAYNLTIDKCKHPRDRSDVCPNPHRATARYLLEMSDLRPGDVLFLSSVSGRTLPVVELAYEAEQFGVKVIGLTSMEYATTVGPVHPSGKRFDEIVTLAIDNCAPAAEAMLEVEGIEARFAAASGIASDYIMWNITAVAVEKLLEKGITPGILKSRNFPGGHEYNQTVVEPHYEQYGV